MTMDPLYEKCNESEEDLGLSEIVTQHATSRGPMSRISNLRASIRNLDWEQLRETSNRRRYLTMPKWITIGKVALCCLAFWGILSAFFQTTKYVEDRRVIDCGCGSSIAEALQKGCKFETMAAAWLPETCRDDELSAEFDHSGPGPDGQWYYWSDHAQKHEISIKELSELADSGKPFFTTWDWHVAHCFWRWRKQIRSRARWANLDAVDAYEHIFHCEEIMQADPSMVVASLVGINGSTFS